jgi:clan AA aspartic protease (TIGR02281 family)
VPITDLGSCSMTHEAAIGFPALLSTPMARVADLEGHLAPAGQQRCVQLHLIGLLPRLHSVTDMGAAPFSAATAMARGVQPHARSDGAGGVRAKVQACGLIALLMACCGNLHPSMAGQSTDADRRLAGHIDEGYGCYVDAMVDGAQFRMLVDTGSDDLAFNRSHLRKLGLGAKQLTHNVAVQTSSGTVRSAPIVVHELRIGTFVMHNVEATVDYAGLSEPLLGMSVIKHMHLEIGRDGCELRW